MVSEDYTTKLCGAEEGVLWTSLNNAQNLFMCIYVHFSGERVHSFFFFQILKSVSSSKRKKQENQH